LPSNDPVLLPLLTAIDEPSRRRALETVIVERVQPVVAGVLSRYRPPSVRIEDSEDLAATIGLRVVRRLQRLIAIADEPIESLNDYVATLSYNVIYDFLRRRYPERSRLKNRLRYLFRCDARFAMWDSTGGVVCGIASWRGRAPLSSILDLESASREMLDRTDPAAALRATFDRAGGPMLLDDLVRIMATLWQVVDAPTIDIVREPASSDPGPAEELETRQRVETMWEEVKLLRPNQRVALLLNLRDVDGKNALAQLLISGIATVDGIAEAIGVSEERLSEIWNDLPFDDLTIASMLQVTRQQVITLRKAARERLARRLTSKDPRKP